MTAPLGEPPAVAPEDGAGPAPAVIDAWTEEARRAMAAASKRADWRAWHSASLLADEAQADHPGILAYGTADAALDWLLEQRIAGAAVADPSPAWGDSKEAKTARNGFAQEIHDHARSLWEYLAKRAEEALPGWAPGPVAEPADPAWPLGKWFPTWSKGPPPGRWAELGTLPEDPSEGRILAWDAWAADWLDSREDRALRQLAQDLRIDARDRWVGVYPEEAGPGEDRGLLTPDGALWSGWSRAYWVQDPRPQPPAKATTARAPAPTLRELAIALWPRVLADLEERLWAQRHKPAGLARQQVLGVVLRHQPNQPQIGDGPPGLPVWLVERATRALRSYPAFQLLGCAVFDSHRQWVGREGLVGRWEFPYGERQLAAWIDAGGGNPANFTDPALLKRYSGTRGRQALEAAAGLMMPHIDPITGAAVTPFAGAIEPKKGMSQGGRRPTRISLTMANDFLPGEAREVAISGGRRAIEDKRITPWLNAPLDGIGRSNEWGAYAGFALRIVAAIRDSAEEVFRDGGADIDPYKIGTEELGMRPALVDACLDRWQRDTPDGRSCFKRLETGRWTITEHFPKTLDPIVEAGRRGHQGREDQKGSRKKGSRKKGS